MNKYKATALVGGSFTMGLLTGIATRRFWSRRYCGDCEGCQVLLDSDYAEWRREKRLNAVCKGCTNGCTRETCPGAKMCDGCYREEEKNPCADCEHDFCDECQEGRTP